MVKTPIVRAESWRHAMREFVIIVAGVLVALAAQAWWSWYEDRGREQNYIAQLIADTRENERRLQAAISEDEAAMRGSMQMMNVIDANLDAPADSLLSWINHAGRASDFQPVTGTYRALVGTADLRLIRTDTLRTLLTSYAASLESEDARLEQLRLMVLNTIGPLGRAMPFMRAIFTGGLDATDLSSTELRRNTDAAVSLFTLQAATANRLSGMRRLLKETQRLRSALEAE